MTIAEPIAWMLLGVLIHNTIVVALVVDFAISWHLRGIR